MPDFSPPGTESDLNGDHYEILSPAADAVGKHPLAATLLLRSMIDLPL